ncbi:CoA transferase [Comamonas serinivorans]|uniref:CoA transferase n=1 Tax=Comamonas serinivorans TaxID=1082851 RepID=A0A1Y0EIZ3_9BURK|nr:CoA transferase [Comamonas serinivorans]ARU03546.1 CoA transferase [Comamonas serinivorans]
MSPDDVRHPPQADALPFVGVRVLEVGPGQGVAFAGKLFADFGAEVIKVEPPAGDELRAWPPLVNTGQGEDSAYFAWLNTNKHSVTADAGQPADQAWLAQLAASADIVLDARALGEQGLAALAQPLVPPTAAHQPLTAQLTWFGDSGPYRHFVGGDAVARAMSGAVHGNGPVEGPPHLPHDSHSGVVTGLATFGTVAAGWLGRRGGSRHYVLSVQEILFHVVEMEAGIAQISGVGPRLGVNRYGSTQPGGIFKTQDSFIGVFTVTLPQWKGLCRAIDRPDMADDPRFAIGPDRMANADEIDAVLREVFPTRTSAEWFERLSAEKHPAVIVPTTEQLMQQTVHRDRGAFVPVQDGQARFEAPVLPQRLGESGPLRGGQAPLLGQHNAHYRGPGLERRPEALKPAAAGTLPLAGVRIIDLTMGWAGPFATRKLADLGAEVIKVESVSYADWWRGAVYNDAYFRGKTYEFNHNYLLMNRNKRGITLDLTSETGRELLKQLVAGADAVIENYSAEVLPKLGLDWPVLREVNPRLVMLTMPAFGVGNAWSNARAYGGTLEQASGLPLHTGHPDGPPAMTAYAYGDPIGGFNSSSALLLGLIAQQRDGKGRHINLSQVEGMLSLAAPYIIEQSVRGETSPRIGNRHARHVPQGIYRTMGIDAWMLVSIQSTPQWQALCEVIGKPDWATDAGLQTLEGRRARQDEIDQAIAGWCGHRSADAALYTLQAAGVPAGEAKPIASVMRDPHLLARGFWCTLERPVGPYVSTTTYYREGGAPMPIHNASPMLGEHTEAVLREHLGLSDERLAELRAQQVIGTSAVGKG